MNAGGIILCILLLANINDHVMIEMEHVLKMYMQQDMVLLGLTLVAKEKLSCTVECHALSLLCKLVLSLAKTDNFYVHLI